jgi:hypothetical protein
MLYDKDSVNGNSAGGHSDILGRRVTIGSIPVAGGKLRNSSADFDQSQHQPLASSQLQVVF